MGVPQSDRSALGWTWTSSPRIPSSVAELPEDRELAARQALALAPGNVPALRELGVSLLRLRDASGAVDALEEAAHGAPGDGEVWNTLGAAYATAGRLDEAEGAWTRAVTLDPEQENARRNLERLRAREGAPR